MPFITNDLCLAIADLNNGKPVAIPTETVYGLAAKIDNENAILSVFSMKNRPLNHPLIVHVAKEWDLSNWVEFIPDYAKQLINAFWPGPLTLVLPCTSEKINPLINGGQTSVAIRCPSHPIAQTLLKQLGIPLVAPSANPFGKISPTTALHVNASFKDKELTILEGGRCSVGIESTIVDATNPKGYKILRHGLIDEGAIAEVISVPCIQEQSALRVPGKLETHYQPQKPLYYFESYEKLVGFCQNNASVYVIARQKPENLLSNKFYSFSSKPELAAFELYYQLRIADESDSSCIAIELPQDKCQWTGLREKILKAGRPG